MNLEPHTAATLAALLITQRTWNRVKVWQGQTCDCAKPATHWSCGPECDECRIKNSYHFRNGNGPRLENRINIRSLEETAIDSIEGYLPKGIIHEVDRKFSVWCKRRGITERSTFNPVY